MRIATLTRSFAAGEISPELFGRIDLTKFQTGLKTCRNFQVLPHGPVVNSPGFDYILETKNSAKHSVLIPFIFNTSQAYQLEFGDQYIRFHTQAGTVLEAGKPISNITRANPGVVTEIGHGYNNGDTVFISGVVGMTQINGRFAVVAGVGANNYQLTYFDGTNIDTTNYSVYTAGGTGARVYEIASPYLEADLQDIHYTQSADVMTLTHPSYDKRELKRIGATNWTLSVISFAQILVAEADATVTNVGGAGGTPKLAEYQIAFVSAGTLEESASYRPRSHTLFGASTTISAVTNANPGVFTTSAPTSIAIGDVLILTGVAGLSGWFDFFVGIVVTVPTASTFTIRKLNSVLAVDTSGLSAFGVGGVAAVQGINGKISAMTSANPGVFTTVPAHGFVIGDPVTIEGLQCAPDFAFSKPYVGVINTIPSATTFTVRDEITGVVLDTTGYVPVAPVTGLVRILGIYNDLTVAGHSNNIRLVPAPLPSAVTFLRYNIYKKFNGLFGFVGASSIPGTFIDNNISPSFAQTPSIPNDPISTVNNYPGESGYWQGRRWFAGTNNSPQGLFATRSGTESNMTYTIPSQDDNSITVRLRARRADTIRHIVPLSDLILLTSGGEWKIPGSTVVTPSSLSYNPEDYIGASNVKPVVTGGSVLYAQDRGGRVRELNFVWQQQGYRSSDLSVMAPHLFDTFTIMSAAYTRAPYSFAWFARSDGVLLGLTYVQEQQVAAWHHRDTSGFFESVCATPEGTEDVLYAIIKRTVNGRTVRYFERQRTRNFGGVLANAFFMDAGATYNGAPATTISGLYHLEGTPVAVLADGVVIPNLVVVNGAIVLPAAASVVSVGLGYVSQLETLPLASEAIPAGGQGATKNVDEVIFRVNQSSDIFIGPRFNDLREVKQRTTEPYGSPPGLMTGIVRQKIDPSWNEDGTVCLQQSNPLPVTILSMSLKVAIGG